MVEGQRPNLTAEELDAEANPDYQEPRPDAVPAEELDRVATDVSAVLDESDNVERNLFDDEFDALGPPPDEVV
jgi:hypothetical protein